ncbi:MAG: molybdopterin-dependent oxidoreductase [Acidimicrobiales bacterium]|nr:molybdopterin-dependent oxidoreductase [Acidimicrobiales bacterium]
MGRRVVIAMGLLGGAGIVVGNRIQNVVGSTLNSIAPNNRLVSLLPGADSFQIYTVSGFPYESTTQYKLSVTGLVDTPLALSYRDLLDMEPTNLDKDFQCVTGWRVPRVKWKGVALSTILNRAGLKNGASAVLFQSFDGLYTESLTINQAKRNDVIVAYEMLGGAISEEHGGPVRLYVAPMYGYKSIKWLSGIEVSDKVVPGYWENLGYDVDAWIGSSNGRTDTPVD